MRIEEDKPLAPFTTLGLGGPAQFYAEASEDKDVAEALRFARDEKLAVRVLGGGSNLVIDDAGVRGLVLRVGTLGVSIEGDIVDAKAGEPWDPLVARTVDAGLYGLECLSGIPGLVGATPIQNVGAYGAEIADVLESVTVLARDSFAVLTMKPSECGFGYRDSVFKREPERFIVLSARFRLERAARPIRYAELSRAIGAESTLAERRETVIRLRRSKSMVIDPSDENRRSAGSFFLNPIVDAEIARRVFARAASLGLPEMPQFPAENGRVKLAAGWLIERAGIAKGTRRGPVGVSTKHALSLVHLGGGTTRELLALEAEVRDAVVRTFGVELEREPVLWRDPA